MQPGGSLHDDAVIATAAAPAPWGSATSDTEPPLAARPQSRRHAFPANAIDPHAEPIPVLAGRSSALLGRDVPDPPRVLRDVGKAVRQVNALTRRWTICYREPGAPLGNRPDRAWHEATATVRTDVMEPLDAIDAECALIATDARRSRLGLQVNVAALAIGSQLQRHPSSLHWTNRPPA